MAKKSNGKPTSKSKRIEQEQVVGPINFELDASAETSNFESTISAVFGVPGVGKSKLAEELGFALQEKYKLNNSGTYFLQCEWINHNWRIRKDMIGTWPTFREFVDKAEGNPEFVNTVKMWVIDTIDSLVPKGISTICHDLQVEELKEATIRVNDGWSAEGWQELRKELRYQILRLASLGPGVLILSHERYRDVRHQGMKVQKATMDLSNSIYNAIGNDCSMVLHMRLRDGEDKNGARCLASLGSVDEDAKDNLGKIGPRYPRGIIPFTTEEEGVRKLMECFDQPIKKVKKVKKKSKKVRANDKVKQ